MSPRNVLPTCDDMRQVLLRFARVPLVVDGDDGKPEFGVWISDFGFNDRLKIAPGDSDGFVADVDPVLEERQLGGDAELFAKTVADFRARGVAVDAVALKPSQIEDKLVLAVVNRITVEDQ